MQFYLSGDTTSSTIHHTQLCKSNERFHTEGSTKTAYQLVHNVSTCLAIGTWYAVSVTVDYSSIPYLSMLWITYQFQDSHVQHMYEQYRDLQYRREHWETENYLDGEVQEMEELYTETYHIPKKDARALLVQMSKYPDLFVDHMMVLELGMLPPRVVQAQHIHGGYRVMAKTVALVLPSLLHWYHPVVMRVGVTILGGYIGVVHAYVTSSPRWTYMVSGLLSMSLGYLGS
jgi:hypothetical protein